ncbi:PREDICTED: probable serine/threonine-protein kinase DDB_G0282963 isoform X2 [Polistes canadensis]|uniref:probable serine/threonine-protein kinase DDB_G0282963 isoform X2 n=1 Tax=Polistes canadensis TaxID=91411 RepID=UPI000718F127|nr:PREDICTED: probable serine/threonine-protein kinase DDB_G0282963 isoform X2 [Polistes canadensis]
MEGGDEIEVLLPCAICGRTFMPRSLEKHFKICERGAIKKRKPFDSAKQRIQGTDLAEFLPRQEKKRYSNDEKRKSCWKETHDDFLRTIRAARNETASMVINQRQSISHASSGAPTRANEKGMCPTCGRQFGIKAYDRHVAWCKERSTRLPISPATKNIAKERLEARMKYRAPALKNRRQSNRDKYSQSCTTVNKTPNKVREIVSVPEHNTREKIKENLSDTQRPSTTGRGEQLNNKETIYQLGKTKETTIKRNPTDSGGDTCKEYDPFLLAERQMNDLLSDSSDLSLTEIPSTSSNKSHSFPLSHSSAFVKYPSYQSKTINHLEKSITNEYDELTSDFSSDSTETNSISQELFIQEELNDKKQLNDRENKMMNKELARRMILDEPSIALGNDIDHRDKSISINHHHHHRHQQQQQQYKNDISNKILDKGGGGGSSTKISKSQFNKSQNVRAYSAPKSIYQRKIKHCNVKDNDNKSMVVVKLDNNNIENDYLTYSNSDDLHSIVSSSSSEIDMMKRSNSVFDQLINSLDDDDIVGNDSFPSLRSLLRNESLRTSSSNHGTTVVHDDNNQFNNGQISDEEFSSTDNYKQQENKINADSAYSSLNRKYSNHHGGRSNSSSNTGGGNNETTNLMGDNLMVSRNIRRENNQSAISKTKCRMSRFCHECGSRFPETAKYCCQCGIKRLAL